MSTFQPAALETTFEWTSDEAMARSPATASLRRLRDALATPHTRPMDRAVLVRSALREAQTGEVSPSAHVPADDRWPDLTHWETAGMSVLDHPRGGVRVSCRDWEPAWLEGSSRTEPGGAAARWLARRVREEDHLEADPFFQAVLGHKTYSSPGQREAVRALALAPDGGTVIANLPTGTGKSAVAYVVAGMKRGGSATAIVVVPTTALALDQERAFLEVAEGSGLSVPPVLAYYGGLDVDAKTDIRKRIRDGSQTIVFTSPESLLGGLRPAVFDAARNGLISLFAVDEAHVAVAWGEEFRPEFQFMAPLRDELLQRQRSVGLGAGFPTLLMSGTLTASVIDRLSRDFGSESPPEVVSAAVLRPEPEYWIAPPSEERDERVLEALSHLPRPAILYTTRPMHADAWRQRLEHAGYGRLAVVHGNTSEVDRRRAMAGVRGAGYGGSAAVTTVDLIIGTSAYGLGVDQPDVRSVVHACVPESLDRYYQEVGRGGRDGRASASILIPASEDYETAEAIATDAIIGVKKARERWHAMAKTSDAAVGGGRRMRLEEVPRYLFKENAKSTAWNLRTLLLLQQSGFLRIRVEEPPHRESGESDEAWDARAEHLWEQQRTTRVVQLLETLDDESAWDRVEQARQVARARGREGLAAMLRALSEATDLAEAFAAEYRVNPGDVPALPALRVRVSPACGGCPACRAANRVVRAGLSPLPPPPAVGEHISPTVASRVAAADGRLLVVVDDVAAPKTTRRLRRAVRRLAEHGLSSVVGSRATLAALRDALETKPVVTSETWEPTALPDVVTAVIAVADTPSIPVRTVLRFGPPRIAFVDANSRDPDWGAQTLASRQHAVPLETFLGEIT